MSEPVNQSLVWDVLRVTEVAAIEAAKLRGRGDEMAADKAAVDAMRSEFGAGIHAFFRASCVTTRFPT